ncbi:MAG TPA: YdcF family protein [Firmicutes bacterium]|nr:YdcF family protein [Bacillota bacterium]
MTEILLIFIGYGTLVHLKMSRSLVHKVDESITCLLILGAQLKNDEPSSMLQARLEKAAHVLKQYPHLKVIVSGGKGDSKKRSEAMVMHDVLIDQFGIEPYRIILEEQAINTFENLKLSKPLLVGNKVLIITNDFHTVRTELLAKRLKIEARTLGVKTPYPKRLKWELREHAAIVKSLVFDKDKIEKNKKPMNV